MAWLNLTMPNQTVKNGLKAKKIKLPQMNFFLKNKQWNCHVHLLAPFIMQNLKKVLGLIQSYENVPFLGPKWPICHEQFFFFFGTNHYYYFHLTVGPFHCAKFKKILTADPELWGCAIFGPKMAHFPKQEFFSENLLMSLVSFIHAYLRAKNQSQILIFWWNIAD